MTRRLKWLRERCWAAFVASSIRHWIDPCGGGWVSGGWGDYAEIILPSRAPLNFYWLHLLDCRERCTLNSRWKQHKIASSFSLVHWNLLKCSLYTAVNRSFVCENKTQICGTIRDKPERAWSKSRDFWGTSCPFPIVKIKTVMKKSVNTWYFICFLDQS